MLHAPSLSDAVPGTKRGLENQKLDYEFEGNGETAGLIHSCILSVCI